MKLQFIFVGKTKSVLQKNIFEDYLDRLSHFVTCDVIVVREATGSIAQNQFSACEYEATEILNKVSSGTELILLDVLGELISSETLAKRIDRYQNQGPSKICFVVGGHWGTNKSVKKRANWTWSLSPLTFTHEMTKIIVVEQLYRAYTILNGFPYSK